MGIYATARFFTINLFLATLFLLNNSLSYSQSENFSTISTQSGLSNSSVLTILKDSQGFIWFGTFNGLNRYDGNSFKVFVPVEGDSSSISCGSIKTLYEDTQGNIWIGTVTGGVNIFNRDLETFSAFSPDYKGEKYLSGLHVTSINEDRDGNVWVGTDRQGINIISKDLSNIRVLKHDPNNKNSLSSNRIRTIYQDSKQNMWVGTLEYETYGGGLNVYNRESDNFVRYMHDPSDIHSIGSNHIRCVFEDSKGRLWIGTNEGLNRYNYFSDDFVRSDVLMPEMKLTMSIMSITEDASEELWLGTGESGLLKYNPQNETVVQLIPKTHNELSHRIWVVYYEPTGILWAGTHGVGIAKLNFNTPQFKHYQTNSHNLNSLRSNNIGSFIVDSEGVLWIGTIDGGLTSVSLKNEYTNYITNQKNQPHLNAHDIYSIVERHPGEIWFATNNGLHIYDKSEKRFKSFNTPDKVQPFKDLIIYALGKDKSGNIWINTLEQGVFIVDSVNNVQELSKLMGIEVDHKWFNQFFVDSKNRVWFSYDDYGFYIIDLKKKAFKHFLYDKDTNRKVQKVFSYLEDNNGDVWLGGSNYLIKFNPETERFHYPDIQIEPSTVVGLLKDNNRIWVSTTRGLYIYNLENSSFEPFGVGETGMQFEYNEGAYVKLENQKMFFGGKDGLISFFPYNMKTNKYIPPVRITDFQIFYKSIKPGKDSPIQKHISQVTQLRLNHKQATFIFRFAALDFSNPESNQYATILEGFEKEWVYQGTRNEVSYSNIPPGKYIFRVKGSNSDGIWNENDTAIRIHIIPPFYASRWFVVSATILFLSVLIFFIYYRFHAIKTRKDELEKMVRQRTEELILKQELLESQNNELEYQKNQIQEQKVRIQKMAHKIHLADQMKIQFFTNISHEFRTPLTLILGVINRLMDSNLLKTKFFEPLRVIQRNSNQLLKLINELLDFSQIEHKSLKLSVAEGNIIDFTQSVFSAFIYRAERHHIHYNFHSELPFFKGYFDGDKLEKILYNLISNAFKFTPDHGHIDVKLDFIKDQQSNEITHCRIMVKDNGSGIDPDKLKKIFKRFYQDYDPGNNTGYSTGIGLSLAEALAQVHKGEICVFSTLGKGSEFVLSIPVSRQLYKDDEMGKLVPKLSDNLIMEEMRDGLLLRKTNYVRKKRKMKNNRNKLLVIDDNADIRSFIYDELNSDFDVQQAADGEEGWEKITEIQPDVILCDILMPKIDGIELCNKLKESDLYAHIPIIMLTAVSGEQVKIKGYELGADDYITKPFNIKILKVRLENLLMQRTRLREKFSKEPFIEPSELDSNSMDTQFLTKAIQVVEENIFNPDFDIQQFISEMAMSKTQIYRKLTTLVGQSATEFIRTIKLKKAAKIIVRKEMTIAEIAYQMGFSEPSYFTKLFKKQFGILPSSYAQHYTNQLETQQQEE